MFGWLGSCDRHVRYRPGASHRSLPQSPEGNTIARPSREISISRKTERSKRAHWPANRLTGPQAPSTCTTERSFWTGQPQALRSAGAHRSAVLCALHSGVWGRFPDRRGEPGDPARRPHGRYSSCSAMPGGGSLPSRMPRRRRAENSEPRAGGTGANLARPILGMSM